MSTAIYPGSFDPVTLGHLNIIKRAAACFDKLIVCVMVNSKKQGMFTPEERVELLRRSTARFPNVEVDFSNELLAEYARRRRAHVVVKGLRAVSDFEQEVQMAVINRKLNPRLETMFLASSDKYTYLSSTVVKEMARYGADLGEFVPREIVDDVDRKMRQAEERSRELRRSANEYCEDALRRTEEAVAEAYDEIKKSRARFRAAASATAAGSPSGGRAAYDAAAEED